MSAGDIPSGRENQAVEASETLSREADSSFLVAYEDNGVEIPPESKLRIFEHGFGVGSGLGLYLIKDMLGITGIAIEENGVHGKGARFEMRAPKGKSRISEGGS